MASWPFVVQIKPLITKDLCPLGLQYNRKCRPHPTHDMGSKCYGNPSATNAEVRIDVWEGHQMRVPVAASGSAEVNPKVSAEP